MSGFSRSQRTFKGNRNKYGGQIDASEKIENSPVLKAFIGYRNELDKKHDKYERLVKMSRDITIESKRIIFLLHSNVTGPTSITVLPEAKSRLSKLIETLFFNISKELEGEDPYQFSRAYYSGIQEFIEAYTFYNYLEFNKLYSWESIQSEMIYSKTRIKDNPVEIDDKCSDIAVLNSDERMAVENDEINKPIVSCSPEDDVRPPSQSGKVKVLLPPLDYILGVQDLTGELMRHCINSLATGKIETMYQTCNFVREIYNGLIGISKIQSKEFYRKLTVLKQSLLKIENACYTVRIRGSEIPKHMLADVVSYRENEPSREEDEGFY